VVFFILNSCKQIVGLERTALLWSQGVALSLGTPLAVG